jgi:hypothetical protein
MPHRAEIRRITQLIPFDEVYEAIIEAISSMPYFINDRNRIINAELHGDDLILTVRRNTKTVHDTIAPNVLDITVKIEISKSGKRLSNKKYTFSLVNISRVTK